MQQHIEQVCFGGKRDVFVLGYPSVPSSGALNHDHTATKLHDMCRVRPNAFTEGEGVQC